MSLPVNAALGYAVGADGVVLKTTDVGSSWSSLASGTTATLRGVAFVDVNTGCAVGDSGVIVRTTNGGTSFVMVSSGTSAALRAMAFGGASVGWAVGEGGTVLKTSDAGASFSAQSAGTGAALYGVDFADGLHGWAVGAGGTIVATTDGGASWAPQAAGTSVTLRAVAFASASAGYAVGDLGTVLSTSDGGSTWTPRASGVQATLRAVVFPDGVLRGFATGDGGVLLHTVDGGATWQGESSGTTASLRGLAFGADAHQGVAVGSGGALVRRVPSWGAAVLYDTQAPSLAPPTLVPAAAATARSIFAGNNAGRLFALRGDRVALYRAAALAGAVQGRSPVGRLESETSATIFAATLNGLGYALDATTGQPRWTTDADTGTPGNQALGDALLASPVVSPSRNLAFFATRNLSGSENRLFAFHAKTGACRWVFNGSCAGATGAAKLGQVSGAPIHDTAARLLFLTSTSLAGGATAWAIDAGDATPGTPRWSRNLGDSDVSPAFADAQRGSVYVGTNSGRVHRLRSSDGASCWSTGGGGCASPSGDELVYCVATHSRVAASACSAGSAVVSSFYTVFSGTHANHLVFGTADGHLRMIDSTGNPVWRTASPIAGASAPLVLPDLARVWVGATDGKLYELSLDTGAVIKTQTVGAGTAAVGSPSFDNYGLMLYVGATDGMLYRFTVPL